MKRIGLRCSGPPAEWSRCVLRGDVHRFSLLKALVKSNAGSASGSLSRPTSSAPHSVVIVAPTSQSARPASFRPEVEINGAVTRVLVEQIGAVDAQRLGGLAGHLSPEELWGVDEALMTVLGLGQHRVIPPYGESAKRPRVADERISASGS